MEISQEYIVKEKQKIKQGRSGKICAKICAKSICIFVWDFIGRKTLWSSKKLLTMKPIGKGENWVNRVGKEYFHHKLFYAFWCLNHLKVFITHSKTE